MYEEFLKVKETVQFISCSVSSNTYNVDAS
jgi:hypothetical protein